MQRLCALFLLVLTGWLMVPPVGAVMTAAQLPACCRHTGVHRCISGMRTGEDPVRTLHASGCALMPRASIAVTQPRGALGTAPSLTCVISWFPFVSSHAMYGHAVALALRSPRAPPAGRLAA